MPDKRKTKSKTHKKEPPRETAAPESAKPTPPETLEADETDIVAERGDEEVTPERGIEEPPEVARQLTRNQVLNRLMEKNEVILSLNRQIVENEKKLKDLNDKWLRSVAEFENYRKRSRKEWELLKQQSKTEVILEVLNIVDDFERAFSAVETEDGDEFADGIKLIYNNLLQIMTKLGVREIDASQAPFDPNFHMAVGQLETEEVESGYIAEVIQKGYLLEDTVIRPSKVIVAK